MAEQWRTAQDLCQCWVDKEEVHPEHSDVGGQRKHNECAGVAVARLHLRAQKNESANRRQLALGGCLSAGC